MYKLPGFYDAHLHMLGIGYMLDTIDCSKYDSIEELTTITSDEDVIYGRGWHQSQFKEQRSPLKEDLNKISTEKPVILLRVCGHVLVCNDKAMELAGVTSNTPQPNGGSFDRETGIFTEDALSMILSLLPKKTKDDIKEKFIKANDYLLSQGITMVGSDDFSIGNVHYEVIIEALEELYNDELMQIRLIEQVNLPTKELLQDYINKGYHKKEYKGFRLGPLKLLVDGSLGGRTAYLKEDYSDDPGNRGIKVFTDEELQELIYIADSNGMDVAIHAIGDGTMDQVLDAIELTTKKTGRTNHNHAIIHAQLATRSQIKRMKELGITAIVQPIFLNSDIPIIEERLGERSEESYLFYTMYKEGVKVLFSSDAPVEPVNPFMNLYCATTRKSIKHHDSETFLNEESYTLEEALTCYHPSGESLVYDDNIIVDRDIHICSLKELLNTKVLGSYEPSNK